MEFYTGAGIKRPVRLSEETRKFAYDSLNFVYGLDTKKTDCVFLDESYMNASETDKYDAAISKIASEAPIRICPGEKISGAATLGAAIKHVIPAKIGNDYANGSISHLTVDFETILKIGYKGIEKKVDDASKKNTDPEKSRFYESAKSCLEAFACYHRRYIEALSGIEEYRDNYKTLQNVPANPAGSFREAVQSIWFTFSFLRLCGNWPGIGRLDVLLGDYLKNDLENGIITLDEARELLAHFFIKGCEWVCGGNYGSGDAQHYQNIVLAGIGRDGFDVTNEVTYLVLDIVEELGISDFPITMRLNQNSDPQLLRRTAEVMRYGGGVIAVYNEDIVLKALTGYGYSREEAVNFANDGCWEVQIPGKTYFSYIPFDALEILQNKVFEGYDRSDFTSFDEIYDTFSQKLQEHVKGMKNALSDWFIKEPSGENGEWHWKRTRPCTPCTVISLFENDCISRGCQYFEGGTVYTVVSPHLGGLADVANSLYAIKKLVYDDKKLSLPEFFSILKNNWNDNEPLRRYAETHYSYYGNDNDEVDAISARIVSDFTDACNSRDYETPVFFPGGISTFGRQIDWAPRRLAAPHGKKGGDVLSGNASPTPGTDRSGATSIIRSYCKADLTKTVTGSALDIQLLPMSTEGEEGLTALISLIQGFLSLGGFFMQIDVADPNLLREAQKHPEQYQTLSVRVSGWNARFATLNKQWQDMVIERAENK
ncbi:MAG: pyruvate formate lyase family protein [Firmicutes bacterium]|nr:pyruvate formate lyase family protein [Bacillota bacterium]